MLRKKEGFTLIEVVVVMAIVAVLAVLIMGAINIARRQARDTQRINDLKTLETALYAYNAKTKNWPANVDSMASCGASDCWCALGVDPGCLEELTVSGVLSSLPVSPGGKYYYYNYNSFIMISTFMDNPQRGPGTDGWRCDWATPSDSTAQPYCINMSK